MSHSKFARLLSGEICSMSMRLIPVHYTRVPNHHRRQGPFAGIHLHYMKSLS
uniref:Uncharacterized protein n=1 Tax=Arundo donax TaxID=35708 RepID=A0A0A9RZI7_ARUDO